MINWFETDNDLTSAQQEQKQRDYRLMFYGSPNNQAVFADIIATVELCEDTEARNVLRDLIKKIKVNCGLDDFRELIRTEAETLNRKVV